MGMYKNVIASMNQDESWLTLSFTDEPTYPCDGPVAWSYLFTF